MVSELTESLEQKRDREYKLILESELYDLPQSNLHVAAATAKVWTQPCAYVYTPLSVCFLFCTPFSLHHQYPPMPSQSPLIPGQHPPLPPPLLIRYHDKHVDRVCARMYMVLTSMYGLL